MPGRRERSPNPAADNSVSAGWAGVCLGELEGQRLLGSICL